MNHIDGLHLIADGLVKDPTVFSEDNLKEMFIQLTSDLDMTIILGPTFKQVELEPSKLTGDAFEDEGGISGYAMISTSHMSIHCWPLRKTFMADLFSCKTFDQGQAEDTIHKFLKPSSYRFTTVRRRPS